MSNTDTPVLRVTFGEFIKDARIRLGLTQSEVGFKASVNQTFVGKVQRGEREPTLNVAIRLCDALGLDINDFVKQRI